MSLREKDIQIIVSLLSDDDPDIAAGIRHKLFDMGEEAVQTVLSTTEQGSRAHREASRVLMRFRAPSLEERFRNLAVDIHDDIDLEEGAFALARLAYPDIDESAYKTRLGHMAFDLAPRVAPDDHPVRIIRTINYYLFDEKNFRGAWHYDPDDSYLNRVIDRKRGWPITLSVIYLILARRLELPIVGIAMPRHYIVKYCGEREIFIDPYNRGQILTANECADMVGEPISDTLLPEASNRFTLFRIMNNLRNTYLNMGEKRHINRLDTFIQILQENV